MFQNALIIGASRGLGLAVAKFLPVHFENLESVTLVSRKPLDLSSLGYPQKLSTEAIALDMSKDDDQIHLSDRLVRGSFDVVIYAAGGGPHGEFTSKEWKDHNWALQLGLVAPMRLALSWLKAEGSKAETQKRFVIVGSRIAESTPDPLASSYAAAKHGLVGFVSSLQKEREGRTSQVWLFSPGYMDTEMLPRTAPVRHDGSKLMSADAAAQAMLRWLKQDKPWHRVLN